LVASGDKNVVFFGTMSDSVFVINRFAMRDKLAVKSQKRLFSALVNSMLLVDTVRKKTYYNAENFPV